MSTKYTPLSNTDDRTNVVSEIPPSYELDDLDGVSGASTDSHSVQPLTVRFYERVDKIIDFELNHYPHLGVKGIHELMKRKLYSMGIEFGNESYQIGVLDGHKSFRLITIDDDRFESIIHYFKPLQQTVIEDAMRYQNKESGVIAAVVTAGIFVIPFTIIGLGKLFSH